MFSIIYLISFLFLVLVNAIPSPPSPCGTLDLTSMLTQHCFPFDGNIRQRVPLTAYLSLLYMAVIFFYTSICYLTAGSHHFVCCVDIQTPENPNSPHGNYNPLEQVIKAASNSSSYSWCTCSEEICTEQLGGRVAWNQNGVGHLGHMPPPLDSGRQVFNACNGLGQS